MIIKGWMKSAPGEDDYTMFVNEQPDGGFKWEFIDYTPDDTYEMRPIWISTKDISSLESEVARLRGLSEWQASMIERVKALLTYGWTPDGGADHEWLADFERGPEK